MHLIWLYFADKVTSSVLIGLDQHHTWATLGFIQSVASCSALCQALSSPRWVELLLRVLSDDTTPTGASSLPRQILSLRLLQAVLPSWESHADTTRMTQLVASVFNILGNALMSCNSDPTLNSAGEG